MSNDESDEILFDINKSIESMNSLELPESNHSSWEDNANDSDQMLSVESDENEKDMQKSKKFSEVISNTKQQPEDRQNKHVKNARDSKQKTASNVGKKTPNPRMQPKLSIRQVMQNYDEKRREMSKNNNPQKQTSSEQKIHLKSPATRQQPNQEILSKTQKMKNYFNELKDTQKILLTCPKTPDEFDKVITGSKIYQQVQKLDLEAIKYIKNKQQLPDNLQNTLNQYRSRLMNVYCDVHKRMSFIERNKEAQKLTQNNKSKQGGRY